MFSKTLTTTVVIALALALFVAWAGHTYSLSVPSQQPAWEITQDAHHSHGEEASSSHASLSEHYHSPLTPDHQHETPQLTAALVLATSPMLSIRFDALRHAVPPPPIFLIERPPRPSFAS
ncbi:hypothetical protein [Pseudomonas sp. SWRI99]|uniref:hypothetical protein n=1 Tax=Pseudomonas sp. SWRI99 TaxID=2745506 RepID=UPI001648E3B8|nr:hypothetical protein [Pseudomonas sp. SWRI99]MBC3776593.1 hypothetical protein [Pseudomonas sp. SWRI99]